jgi:putative transposase
VLRDAPKVHRQAVALSLAEFQTNTSNKTDAMAQAYYSTAYTMEQIADHFGVSASTVSRAIRRHETEQERSKS